MFTPTLIAVTGDRFADFAPYVASVNEAGTVAFQAVLRDGSMGVFIGRGAEPEAAGPTLASVSSHPAINDAGDIAFYGAQEDGGGGVFLLRGGAVHTLATVGRDLATIGPLGPTINEAGRVAFRADLAAGMGALLTADLDGTAVVADGSGDWARFHGLPVIVQDGSVVFRADRRNGVGGIYRNEGGSVLPVAETGARFSGLGHVPSAADDGSVAFAARLRAGGEGIFLAGRGKISQVIGPDGAFESCRGALIADRRMIVAIATPRRGSLGLVAGPDPERDRIVAIGDELLGSVVADLAANPVSLNRQGQVATRIGLADGRQLIVRMDPPDRTDHWMVGGEGLEPPTFSV